MTPLAQAASRYWVRIHRVPLVGQIAVGMLLGIGLALAWPAGARGVALLGETVTPWMLFCGAIVLCGTALATGVVKLRI